MSTTNPLEVTIDSNKTIGATFITAIVEEVLVAGDSFLRHVTYDDTTGNANSNGSEAFEMH